MPRRERYHSPARERRQDKEKGYGFFGFIGLIWRTLTMALVLAVGYFVYSTPQEKHVEFWSTYLPVDKQIIGKGLPKAKEGEIKVERL